MSSVRGLNTSTIQATPSPSPSSVLNMTNNALIVYLRNSPQRHNMTAEEINIALGGDPSPSSLQQLRNDQIIAVCGFIIICSLGWLLGYIFEKSGVYNKLKHKIHIPSSINWIRNKYVEMTKEHVLPVYRPKKAKESPFVSSMPMPQILPQCPNLEGAEKGQNLMFKLSVPYRRFQSSENLPAETEHRITITTTVEQTKSQSPKI
jgi:hypothetical protein